MRALLLVVNIARTTGFDNVPIPVNELYSFQWHQLQDSSFDAVRCTRVPLVDVQASAHVHREFGLVSTLWQLSVASV